MAQANPFDQFDSQVQPVPVQSLQPIIGSVSPEEQARRAREEARQEEAARRAAASEERAVAEFEGTGGKPTESQAKTSTLLTRIQGGFQDIMSVRERNPEAQSPGIGETLAEGIFGEGIISRGVAGADRRIVRDAQRDVLDALLTLGTGAAYNAEQLEGQTVAYFPRFGDTPEEIAAKNDRLQRLIEAAKVQAGPKWAEIEQAIAPFMSQIDGQAAPPTPAGSEAAPTYRIITHEQSAEIFGEARFDPQGNPIGRDYVGETVLADGAPGPFMGRVTDTDPREQMGFIESIGETITGSERETEETRNLPDWATMPELNSLSVDSFQAALGTMITNPAESVSIIRSQFPGVQVRQDEKGNFILRSSVDGQEYAIKPGFRASDIPRAIGGIAAFTPAGRATTAGGAALSGGLTQTGIELSQAGTGGEFNAEEVLLASGGNVLGQQIGRGVNAVRNARAARTASPETAPMQPAPTQAPAQPAAMADELVTPPLAPEVQAEVGAVARQAIGRGRAATEAREKLAIMAKINPEAKAAAERLGMDLPADILSDDTRLLTVTGLARSQAGSDAENAWKTLAIDTIQKADANLEQIGASRNLAGVSNDVRNALQSNMDELEAGANRLREEVNAAIDVRGRVTASNLQRELGKTINDLGGIEEAKLSFGAEEKKLLAMLGEGEVAKQPTYATLDRIRNQIGEALFKGKGPWVDTEEATLKRYYGALAQDRLGYVAEVGGEELANKMRGSNDLYSKMYDVRDTMQTLFGKLLENDISTTITRAITQGKSGNAKDLRKIIQNVPEDMRARALLTGLMSATGKGGANGGFSFTKYAEAYRGLRENAPIYAEIAKTIGPDADRILRDLYSISKRMARAENAVLQTGKANQPLINALAADGLVSNVAKSAAKRAGVTGASSVAGGMVGGPIGAGVAAGVAEAVQQAVNTGGKSNLDKLHGVLVSEPFKDLVDKVATGTVREAHINRVANDKAWRRYAKTVLGIQTPAQRKAWLTSAISQTGNTNPEPMTTSTIEVR